MAVSFQQMYQKAQRMARDNTSGTLTQLKEDINTGYHLFNAQLARYYTRKQQFTDLVAGQQIYQTPIDCIRVLGMTVQVTQTYFPTVTPVYTEYDWRNLTSYPMQSSWPTHFFMLGNDEFALWPIPAQSLTNGIRFYYQPQDFDLTLDDTVSTSSTLAIVTNGSATVTANGTPFNAGMVGLWFQVTGETDNTFYEIVAATTSTLTLKSAYVSTSGGSKAWRVAQLSIIPQQYDDAPVQYALGNYFSTKGNEARSQFHLGTPDKPGMFYQLMEDCKQEYSSSSLSNVIADGDMVGYNIWLVQPPAAP